MSKLSNVFVAVCWTLAKDGLQFHSSKYQPSHLTFSDIFLSGKYTCSVADWCIFRMSRTVLHISQIEKYTENVAKNSAQILWNCILFLPEVGRHFSPVYCSYNSGIELNCWANSFLIPRSLAIGKAKKYFSVCKKAKIKIQKKNFGKSLLRFDVYVAIALPLLCCCFFSRCFSKHRRRR